jgi:hypothetical protein
MGLETEVAAAGFEPDSFMHGRGQELDGFAASFAVYPDGLLLVEPGIQRPATANRGARWKSTPQSKKENPYECSRVGSPTGN